MSDQQTMTQTGTFQICGEERIKNEITEICIASPVHTENEHEWYPYTIDKES